MAEVELTRDDAVLTLTLNRPDVLNAFDTAMHKAFAAGLREASHGAFDVADRFERFAQIAEQERLREQLANKLLTLC